MKKLRISIIDLIHNSPSQSLYRRFMFNNYASIMPQVVGVWCREEGHEVHYSLYTGTQKVETLLEDDRDLVFISSFSFTAQLAYALSAWFRSKGIATVLGGPHARSYPDDACLYFDYVLGLTDKEILRDLLQNFEMRKSIGTYLSASSQPSSIPGVRERWEFMEQLHKSASVIKGVSMIGSFGCPYECDFCVDADIPFQTLDQGMIKEDLRFIVKKMKRPLVSWYDPNFGIRFHSMMETIESAVPPGSIRFMAECTLSSLSEDHVKVLKRNGFKMLMLGIESWYDYGKKAKMESLSGMEKVRQVAERVNMIQSYIPQVHANIMYGFDNESGPEPFELTRRFLELAPAAYPAYAILTVFGHDSRNHAMYEAEDRIIPFPFHSMHGLNNLNVLPKNYTWEEFYSNYLDLLKYSFSRRVMYRRFKNNPMFTARWLTLFLSFSVGASGKIGHVSAILEKLRKDSELRAFMDKRTEKIPAYMIDQVKRDLGPMWEWLPNKSLSQHQNVRAKSASLA